MIKMLLLIHFSILTPYMRQNHIVSLEVSPVLVGKSLSLVLSPRQLLAIFPLNLTLKGKFATFLIWVSNQC